MTPHAQSIHAILFATAEPVRFSTLASRLELSLDEVHAGLASLKEYLEGSAVLLVLHDDTALLAVRPEYASLIEAMRKEEVSKELTKASAETLAVVAYMPGISKSQIEFIRGVNASYSLRNLQMRGLIESKGAGRAVGYYPTIELLQHYGVDSIEGLPQYSETKAKIEQLMNQSL